MSGPAEDALVIPLIIRPVDSDGWIMGDDLIVRCSEIRPFRDVMEAVYRMKTIHPTRQSWTDISIKGKPIEPNSYGKTLRMLGIRKNSVLSVTPLFPRAWMWETYHYYETKLCDEVRAVIKEQQAAGIAEVAGVQLKSIKNAVTFPRPLQEKGSLLALLRKFPEHFRVEERTRTGEVLVRLTTGRTDIPMWL